ncbi:spore coat protein [Eubacterium sp. LMAG:50]|uniref:spore coat protein n=1 Tax=Eubacterium sp. LMAG:50 TaxID=1969563 RepID=UPI0025BBC46B|nr:spore coat protein [Eubacterium sp. LMAG:50]
MQEKYMVIDSLEGINSEIEKFGNMIPQTENKELKQTLKEMRNKCEMSQERLAQIATAKNYYVPAAQASEQEIQSVKSIFQ